MSPGPAPKGEKVWCTLICFYHRTPTHIWSDHCCRADFSHFQQFLFWFLLQGDSGIIGPVGLIGQTGRKVNPPHCNCSVFLLTSEGWTVIPSADAEEHAPLFQKIAWFCVICLLLLFVCVFGCVCLCVMCVFATSIPPFLLCLPFLPSAFAGSSSEES